MKIHLLRFCSLCVWLLTPELSGAQQPSEFVNAYVYGVRAEQAESAGQLNEALEMFSESLRIYQEAAKLHPDWKPSVVQYRITTTANHMERIKRLVEVEHKKKMAESEAAIKGQLDQAIAGARSEWLKEKENLDVRIAELMAERTSMQEVIRSGQAELKKNQELLAELEKVIAAGGKRIDDLEKKRDDAKAKVNELQADVAAKEQRIASLQAEITNQPPPLISSEELETLRRDLAASTSTVAELTASVSALTENVDSLTEKLKTVTEQRAKLQSEKKDADASHEAEVGELKRAGLDLIQQMAVKDQMITELQDRLTNQPPPLITSEELLVLQARVHDLQQDSEQKAIRQQALEQELSAATNALEAAKRTPVNTDEPETSLAEFEKSQVENIVFRDTIHALSNQLAVLSARVVSASDELAREQKNWNTERSQLNDRVKALLETVDLNQEEIGRVRDLKATVKRLEKENSRLAKEIDSARAKEPVEE